MAHVHRERFSIECYCKRGFVTHLLPVENPFFAIVDTKWEATGAPVGAHWVPTGRPMGTQCVQSGHHSRLSGSIGAGYIIS